MENCLILADQLVQFIRQSGATKLEAYAALEIAGKILVTVEDISFARYEEKTPAPPAPEQS